MKIVILGGGESGVGAALLAQAKGFEVFLSDKGPLGDKYKAILTQNNIAYEENQHTEALVLSANEIIKSPGIPDKVEIIQKLKALKIPIISEIEFASRYTTAKIIAITGSNGKTTTTMLVYHILKNAGYNVGLGGNIGESFAKQVINPTYDYFVLELSSFQLDNVYDFKADVAILLNITPDHLDRYNYDFELYVASKFRITQNMGKADTFIYFAENEPIKNGIVQKNISIGHMKSVSIVSPQNNDGYSNGTTLNINHLGKNIEIPTVNLPLKGSHNHINMLCASIAALAVGVSETDVSNGLHNFINAPHRLEFVKEVNGISYVNDSKATNVDSVFYALGSFEQPIVLIIGGVDKGNDYKQIEQLVSQKVKAMVCLGADNSKLKEYFKNKVYIIDEANSMEMAITKATEMASKGDVVLLSPACASFDLFKNYEDRGNQFRNLVQKL